MSSNICSKTGPADEQDIAELRPDAEFALRST
jgi:hypothetical protein